MKRYVLKNMDGRFYQPAVNEVYVYDNFVDSIEDAYWYVSEQTALKAMNRYGLHTKIIGIEVAIQVTGEFDTHDRVLAESKKLCAEWDTLTNAQAEALSQAAYKQYKNALRYVREHG